MPAKDFEKGIENLDIKLLERLLKQTTAATDRTGNHVFYYIPLKEEFTDVCQYIFDKHGIKLEKYQSSLNKWPVLKIDFKGIDALTQKARDFLFKVNVNPDELQKHYNNIVAEMRSKNR